MTNLTEMITTLQQAQEAVETLERWKKEIFERADHSLIRSVSPTATDSLRRSYAESFFELNDLMAELGIRKEWENSSTAYVDWKKQREAK